MKWLTDILKKLFVDWWKKRPDAKPEPTADEWTSALLHLCPEECRNWPVVSKTTVTVNGGNLVIDVDSRDKWPDIGDRILGNTVCLLFRDGRWHAGPWDGLRPYPCTRSLADVCVPASTSARFATPEKGERVGIMPIGGCRAGEYMRPKQRGTVAWVVWP